MTLGEKPVVPICKTADFELMPTRRGEPALVPDHPFLYLRLLELEQTHLPAAPLSEQALKV